MAHVSGSGVRRTVLFSILFLFFIQLTTVWIESIYRMSLIKLSPGKEVAGVLLSLLPLLLLLVGKRAERVVLWLSVLILLTARALCPALGAIGLIIVAGIGVAAFLVILSYSLSAPHRFLQGDMGIAVGIAVLLSVMFRSWGSSLDISMEGSSAIIGWLLIPCALYLFRDVMSSRDEIQVPGTTSCWGGIPPVLGLFSNFTFIHLVLSSPAVVSAWSGSSNLVGTALLVASLAGVILWYAVYGREEGVVSNKALIVANVFFAALLLEGIRLQIPALPAGPASPPAFAVPARWYVHLPFYLMFLLSPVLVINVRAISKLHAFARPRSAVLPVMLGMCLLFAFTLLLIFTNVWGYVGPIGHMLRNRFYFPFLLAGIGTVVPYLIPARREPRPPEAAASGLRPLGVAGWVLAALAVGGVVWNAPKGHPADLDRRQLTIMTYNMQQGSEIGGDRNYREQLALLRKVDADIIGLQESDTPRPSGGNVDAVRYFADGLGYFSYYGPNTVAGTFGTAILSRFPIKNPRTFFTFSDVDETATAEGEIEVGGNTITFFCNHPAGHRESKTAHIEALAAEAAKYPRVISVGDYNFDQNSPWYHTITGTLNDSWLSLYPDAIGELPQMMTGTFVPTRKTRRIKVDQDGRLNMTDRIDHIFLSHNFRVLESYYLPPPNSETDHPAHWSVIGWE
jgi:endonuclease/exonuclease/phosphatase family metal-dependent hydrolase